MGLEAINFFFRSEEQLEDKITSNKNVTHIKGKQLAFKKDHDFWIDLELQDQYSLSIRITLCNPKEIVLKALHDLLSFLFDLRGAVLKDMNTKQTYNLYDEKVKKELEDSYHTKQKTFTMIYGNDTAAISSKEFYKKLNNE